MASKLPAKIVFVFLVSGFSFISCSRPLYKNTFVVAGTYLEVTSPYKEAAKIAYEEFKRLEKIFNLYDELSELSRLNKSFDQPVKVSDELIEVLSISFKVHDLTGAAFDVSHGALYQFWKQYITSKQPVLLPMQEEIERVRALGGMSNIAIDFNQKTVTIKKQGLRIDLGAIAKGYMVDKAALKLKREGINSALINAGGDIYCLGLNQGQPWHIGVKDPKSLTGILEAQDLADEAVATSGNYEQFFELAGKRYSHLIDPRQGLPVDNGVLSVSVITKNCTSADSLATAFFVLGLEGIRKFLADNPSTMRIMVVTQDQQGQHIHMLQ